MGSKSKGGREVRKPKTSVKVKENKSGTDTSKRERQDNLPHSK